jgi:hypothetical protein
MLDRSHRFSLVTTLDEILPAPVLYVIHKRQLHSLPTPTVHEMHLFLSAVYSRPHADNFGNFL